MPAFRRTRDSVSVLLDGQLSGWSDNVAFSSAIELSRRRRGYQASDANGAVQSTTIYPGWYMGRAVHIHFKVRTNPGGSSGLEFGYSGTFNARMRV